MPLVKHLTPVNAFLLLWNCMTLIVKLIVKLIGHPQCCGEPDHNLLVVISQETYCYFVLMQLSNKCSILLSMVMTPLWNSFHWAVHQCTYGIKPLMSFRMVMVIWDFLMHIPGCHLDILKMLVGASMDEMIAGRWSLILISWRCWLVPPWMKW